MTHFPRRYLLLLILVLAVVYFFLRPWPNSTPVSQLSSISPLPNPQPNEHCLSEEALSQIVNQNYHLESENFYPEAMLLSCDYQTEQLVNELIPTVEYTLSLTEQDAQARWQRQQTEVSGLAKYRRIEDDVTLFATVNPVQELNQVTFFGYQSPLYLELTYTPVQEEVGTQLEKGKQLMQLIFKKDIL